MSWKSLSPETRTGLLTLCTTVTVAVAITFASKVLGLGIESSAVPIGGGVALLLFWPKVFVKRQEVKTGHSGTKLDAQQITEPLDKVIADSVWSNLNSRMQAHMYVSLIFGATVAIQMNSSLWTILPLLAFLVSFGRLYNLFEEINGR